MSVRPLLDGSSSRLRGHVGPVAAALSYLALAVPTLGRVGLSWDEWIYLSASKAHWLYYVTLFGSGRGPTDPALMDLWRMNSEHPPVAKSLSSLTWGTALALNGGHLDVWSSIAAHRLSTALLAAVSIYLVGRLATVADGPAAGAVAAVALAFTPRFFAHSRYLALDVPMAAAWVIAVWTFRRGFDDARYAALTGVAFGFAVATKLNAFFIPFAVGAWLLVAYRRELVDRLRRRRPVDLGDRRERYAIVSLVVLTPLTVVALWPYLWVHPVEHALAYVEYHLQHFPIPLYYLGRTYPGPGPWHYPFVMVAVTVPVTILALALVGAGRAVADAYGLENRDTPLLLTNALVPLVVIALPTHAYDGVRLFMPSFPFLAALAGIGAAELVRRGRAALRGRVGRRSVPSFEGDPVARYGPVAVALLLVATPGGMAYAADGHHENSYFNGLIGGREGALDAGFEIEYWQQAYAETLPFLNERAAAEGTVRIYVPVGGSRPYRIYRDGDISYFLGLTSGDVALPAWVDPNQTGVLDDDVVLVDDPAEADYYVFITRQGHWGWGEREWRLFRHGRPAFRHTAGGAPLVQAYRTNETNRRVWTNGTTG